MKSGFTLIELIIVVAFLGIAGALTVVLIRNQLLGSLESEVQAIRSRLQEAQTRAIAGVEGTHWGIYFNNASSAPWYALFPGSSFSAASSTYFLSRIVEFQAPASGTSTAVIFSKRTGTVTTTASVIIRLKNDTAQTKTITISSQGRVNVE